MRAQASIEIVKDNIQIETESRPQVFVAGSADIQKIVDVILLGFSSDPCVRWLYPDPHQYVKSFPVFTKLFGGRAIGFETAYYADGYHGAALWLPPGEQPDEEALAEHLNRTVKAYHQKEVFSLFEKMDRYHPSEPHRYLPLIAVDPVQQRKGVGSAILKYSLDICDRDMTLAYLESSNPMNIPLYQRHGFKIMGTIQVGSSPPITPMLREPQRKSIGTCRTAA